MMQSKIDENDTQSKLSNDSTEVRQHFINDNKFQLLRQFQQEIFEKTEVSLAIRKIVNDLINEENLQKLKSKFVSVWSN